MASTATRGSLPSRLTELPTSLIIQAAAIARQHVDDALAVGGVREHHYIVLAVLHEVGPVTASELARDTSLDRADITATVSLFNRKGYLERTADRTDRRRVLLTLTPAGRQQLDRLDQLLFRAQAELLADLSNRERVQLIRLLTAVVTGRQRRPATLPQRRTSTNQPTRTSAAPWSPTGLP